MTSTVFMANNRNTRFVPICRLLPILADHRLTIHHAGLVVAVSSRDQVAQTDVLVPLPFRERRFVDARPMLKGRRCVITDSSVYIHACLSRISVGKNRANEMKTQLRRTRNELFKEKDWIFSCKTGRGSYTLFPSDAVWLHSDSYTKVRSLNTQILSN